MFCVFGYFYPAPGNMKNIRLSPPRPSHSSLPLLHALHLRLVCSPSLPSLAPPTGAVHRAPTQDPVPLFWASVSPWCPLWA